MFIDMLIINLSQVTQIIIIIVFVFVINLMINKYIKFFQLGIIQTKYRI